MSSAPAPLAAGHSEPKLLAALDTETAAIAAYIQTFPQAADASTFGKWLARLDDFAWRLIQFTPLADSLERDGRPEAKQKLLAATYGLGTARQKYIESRENPDPKYSPSLSTWTPQNEWVPEMTELNSRYQRAVAKAWSERSFNIDRHSCYACRMDIGVPGGGYCRDCARRRDVISPFES